MAKGQAVSLTILKLIAFVCAFQLIGSAHVQAESSLPLLLITEIQTQSISSKTEEYIEINNPSEQDFNVSQLRVKYLSASGGDTVLSLSPTLENTALKSHGHLLLAQEGYQIASDATFRVGLSDTGGHIQLVLGEKIVDTVGWGTATIPEGLPAAVPVKGSVIARTTDEDGTYLDTNNNFHDFSEAAPTPEGGGLVEAVIDVCPNIEGIQVNMPIGYELAIDANCILSRYCDLLVSEVSAQPNSDSQEYVELLNSSTESVWPALCALRINNGALKSLPDVELPPRERMIALFSSGTIRNSAGEVSILSSAGQTVTYMYPTTIIGQTVNFSGSSTSGYVSDKPTPGAVNQDIIVSEEELLGDQGEEALIACPAGKYRNPLSNRCKNIESTVAVLAECDDDQERNPLTNRCRKITTAVASLVPCKAGQERNPETNRCRSIGTAALELKPCAEGQERNPETNRCRKIVATNLSSSPALGSAQTSSASPLLFSFKIVGALLGAVVLYALYEYRVDIRNILQKAKIKRLKGRPPD